MSALQFFGKCRVPIKSWTSVFGEFEQLAHALSEPPEPCVELRSSRIVSDIQSCEAAYNSRHTLSMYEMNPFSDAKFPPLLRTPVEDL